MHWRLAELIVFSIFAAGIADAQIYEWRDARGNRHFTNNLLNLSADQQAAARVVVVAKESLPETAVEGTDEPAEAPRRQAEVVVQPSPRRDRYAEGLRDGLLLAASAAQRPERGVYISGPLAVAKATVDRPAWLYPYRGPLVTTSFDRGRSRHLTLRMLLQDQFQLDRDGPFVYERRVPVGLGPKLQARLPRGLPHHRPTGTRSLPVITK